MADGVSGSQPAADRADRVRGIVEDCIRRREQGEPVSDESLVRSHPDLMPELGEHLHRLRLIENARLQAVQLNQEPAAEIGSDEPVPQSSARIGVVHYFGDYILESVIGRGGMGIVYRARQVSLPRVVALKMMLAELLATPRQSERFHLETQTAASLEHPGIVPIYEVGRHEGRYFFSMAFVDGQSRADKLRAGPLAGSEAARYVKMVAEAIHYAHERGVIHRDIKPANVLIDRERDEPHVTDFGLAKQLDRGTELTATGQIMGTPGYMPPEQALGDHKAIGPHGKPDTAQLVGPTIAFTLDGSRIVSASPDGRLGVWDSTTGGQLQSIRGHSDLVRCVVFSWDGKWIISGGDDDIIRIWDSDTGEELFSLCGHSKPVLSVAVSSDMRRIASGSSDHTVKVWDTATGEQTLTLKGHEGPVHSVAFSPDDTQILSGSQDGTVRIWDGAPRTLTTVTPQSAQSAHGHFTDYLTDIILIQSGRLNNQTISSSRRWITVKAGTVIDG